MNPNPDVGERPIAQGAADDEPFRWRADLSAEFRRSNA
jgi:hypothetical protein